MSDAQSPPQPGNLAGIPESALLELIGLPPGTAPDICDAVLHSIRQYCLVLDSSCRVRFVNHRLAELLGGPPGALLGIDWIDTHVPAPERVKARARFTSLVTDGQPQHHQAALAPWFGETHYIEWDNAVLRDSRGAVQAIVSFGQDVTELVSSMASLREEAARHQDMLDHAVDPIITIDQHGLVHGFNRAAERVFGWEARDVVGRNVSMLMPSPDRERHDGYLANYLAGRPPKIIGIGREVVGLRRNGETFPMQLGVSEIRDVRAGRLFTGMCSDLSEIKRTERELRRAHDELKKATAQLIDEQSKQLHAERLSSIGLLAAGMAHEINNPLMGVISCVKGLREGRLTPERREDYYEAIREGLERIQTTVRSLLDYARQRPPTPTDLDPGPVIDACLRLLTPAIRKKDIHVEVELDEPALIVHADSSQLMQALANLLMNSVYAVPTGGHIRVAARAVGGRVALSVADDGPGMDRATIEKVCDPFFTTKPIGEGTGLGLAVTLGIARGHGGDLQIESEVGEGTVMTLWFPRAGG